MCIRWKLWKADRMGLGVTVATTRGKSGAGDFVHGPRHAPHVLDMVVDVLWYDQGGDGGGGGGKNGLGSLVSLRAGCCKRCAIWTACTTATMPTADYKMLASDALANNVKRAKSAFDAWSGA